MVATVSSTGRVTAVGLRVGDDHGLEQRAERHVDYLRRRQLDHPFAQHGVQSLGHGEFGFHGAAITFTAVSDGTGQPASYDLRYAAGSISWGSANSVSAGSCKAPIAGAAVGSTVHCTVLGLAPSTSYQFQVVAFRGSLNSGSAVFGSLSNVASAATSAAPAAPAAPPPALPWRR